MNASQSPDAPAAHASPRWLEAHPRVPEILRRVDEAEMARLVTSVHIEEAGESAFRDYARRDLRRFVLTTSMALDLKGQCLELGAAPYFNSMLLQHYTGLELRFTNYFGAVALQSGTHRVRWVDPRTGQHKARECAYEHFNAEDGSFPYPDQSFDAVVFAELLEHLLEDPSKVLGEIRRVLKPSGQLILTTPNVARFTNTIRLLRGEGIGDRYSGHGPYGRHNREYSLTEVERLLSDEGFRVDLAFTADVSTRLGFLAKCARKWLEVWRKRKGAQGQYIFIRATADPELRRNAHAAWLYRDFAPKP